MAWLDPTRRILHFKVVYVGDAQGCQENLRYLFEKTAQDARSSRRTLRLPGGGKQRTFELTPRILSHFAGLRCRFHLHILARHEQDVAHHDDLGLFEDIDGLVFVACTERHRVTEARTTLQKVYSALACQHKDLNDIPVVIQYKKNLAHGWLPIELLQQQLNRKDHPFVWAVTETGQGTFATLQAIGKQLCDRWKQHGEDPPRPTFPTRLPPDQQSTWRTREGMAYLRQALSAEPSQRAWSILFDFLATWPADSQLEEAVHYVAPNLSHWPGELRRLYRRYHGFLATPKPHPLIALIRALSFSQNLPGSLAHLAAHPLLTQVDTLSLSFMDFPAHQLPQLLQGQAFQQLRELVLTHIQRTDGELLDPEELAALFHGPAMAGLKSLKIDGFAYSETLLSVLQQPETTCTLHTFKIHIMRQPGLDLPTLFQAPFLQQIEHLDLSGNTFQAGDCRALAESGLLKGLKSLHLDRCQLSGQNLEAILCHPDITSLETLSLTHNHLGYHAWRHLAYNEGRLANLRVLRVQHNAFPDDNNLEMIRTSSQLQLDELDIL